MDKLKIFVAVHKKAPLYGDSCYQFIHVGASRSKINIEGALRDNAEKDNISDKNDIYCELTGLYYIWKNVKDVEYVGLCHYRRFPAKRMYGNNPNKEILSEKEILDDLKNYDIILLNPRKKNGELNGLFVNNKDSLDDYRPYKLMLPAIEALYPDYLADFKQEFFTKDMSFGNIMICDKKKFDSYCTWLFAILFKVENDLKQSNQEVEPRELGYFSEWLLNVWVRHNKLNVKYVPVYFVEPTNTIKYQLKKLLHRK